MKSTEENNRLIAEFMGVKTEKFASGILNFMYEVNGNNEGFEVGELSYHTSWDWLMPVVDKIEDMRDENNGCLFNVSTIQTWTEIIDCRTSDTIAEGDAETKIQSVFDAVVEFIKWHNSI